MKAAVIAAARSIEVVEVPDPVLLGSAGAIVKVEATAICGSDLHIYTGAMPGVQAWRWWCAAVSLPRAPPCAQARAICTPASCQ